MGMSVFGPPCLDRDRAQSRRRLGAQLVRGQCDTRAAGWLLIEAQYLESEAHRWA